MRMIDYYTVVRDFHFGWNIKHSPIFEESQNAFGSGTFGFRRVPLNAEDRNAEACDPADDFAKFHELFHCELCRAGRP
ncbi:hypothetical protein BI343_04235 [Chromobacterium amazonense]|nr:hypothetical protein BI343_04235 [Chromobacterium amazonense]